MIPGIIGAIVTAALTVLIRWLENKQQTETDIVNAVSIAAQQAMLTSTVQAQTVQHSMSTATVPVITDVASAQVAFGLTPTQKSILPKYYLATGAGYPNTTMANTKRSMAILKSWGLIVLLTILAGCAKRPVGGAVGQYPVIDNPAPPPEMFVNPEVALTEREKAGLNWSAPLYNRVKIYNQFATDSNAAHGYYAPSIVTKAKRLFE